MAEDLLRRIFLLPDVRPRLVARARQRLDAGSLATPEQVAGVLVAMLAASPRRRAPAGR